MQENDKPVLVYATFPDAEAAREAGRELVEMRLAACVNIIPGMTSIYRWQGAINEDREVVMIIKTRAGLSGAVVEAVRACHAYENPALLVLPIEGGSEAFLRWIMAETEEAGKSS